MAGSGEKLHELFSGLPQERRRPSGAAQRALRRITEIRSLFDLQGSKIVEYPAVLEVRLLSQSKMKIIPTIGGHLRLLGYLASERRSASLSSKHAASGQRQHL